MYRWIIYNLAYVCSVKKVVVNEMLKFALKQNNPMKVSQFANPRHLSRLDPTYATYCTFIDA